jgi:hypothetical protein
VEQDWTLPSNTSKPSPQSNSSVSANHTAHGEHCRCEARDSFKMANYVHVKVELPNEDEKQAEAANTARLRSLRLAKEAADREHAGREVALTAQKVGGRA